MAAGCRFSTSLMAKAKKYRINSSCRRKVRHDTREAAREAMWMICSTSPRRWVDAYHCPHCDGWHWGVDPAAVVFERDSLRGHTPPRREAGQSVAADVAPSLTRSGRGVDRAGETRGQDPVIAARMTAIGEYGVDGTASAMKARDYNDATDLVAHSLRGERFDASEDGTGRGTPLVPVAIQERAVSENPNAGPDGAGFRADGTAYTLEARSTVQAVAFNSREDPEVTGDRTGPLGASSRSYVAQTWAVRRLTPRECERLQGFPDDFTLIPRGKKRALKDDYLADEIAYLRLTYPEITEAEAIMLAADGPRYKALGNSMAVPVIRWIMDRIRISWEQMKDAP